jgi:uncharacterized protein YbbC (DUF1343 family)
MRVTTGIETLLAERGDFLRGRRIGLATNPTGVLPDLTSTIDALLQAPGAQLVALFGPEHGLHAGVQDAIPVGSSIDADTMLPVHSLYGERTKPDKAALQGIDLLIFDMQDVGCRFYTYLYTMSYLMQAAAENGLPIAVLDRPNPLSGSILEGNLLDARFSSFVGLYPLPVRYGLTIGELALLFNSEFGIHADLTVVPLRGWRRDMWFEQTGLPWVMPSPNMPTPDTAVVYPGMCLVEGTNLSEGRGTTHPFELAGAPWVNGRHLAARLNDLGLPGVRFRPADFAPTYGKFSGECCGGVQVHVTDRALFRPLPAGLHVVATVKQMYPQHFAWLAGSWEGSHPHIDLLMGTDLVRRRIDAGAGIDEITCDWDEQCTAFAETSGPYRLYNQ